MVFLCERAARVRCPLYPIMGGGFALTETDVYRARAADCREFAARCADPEDRRLFLSMAASWSDLADTLARSLDKRKAVAPSPRSPRDEGLLLKASRPGAAFAESFETSQAAVEAVPPRI